MHPSTPSALDRAADSATALSIEGEFNIFTAQHTKGALLDAIAAAPGGADGDIVIGLGDVTEIDTAGLQLMVMAHREALRQGKHLRFTPCSQPVMDIVSLCGMAAALGLPTPAPSQPVQP